MTATAAGTPEEHLYEPYSSCYRSNTGTATGTL
jgi:hypothetical protein